MEASIEFHRVAAESVPEPRPADRLLPAYLQHSFPDPYSIAPGVEGTPNRNAMLKAAALGQIIPLSSDTRFNYEPSGQLSADSAGLPVRSQYPEQVAGTPMQGRHVAKFLHPWIIQTPPGYSSLILPALNRFEMPFEVLSGLVETDTYYRPVFLPSLSLMQLGQVVELSAGTPLAQVIPIRRQPWRSEITSLGTSDAPDPGVIRFAAENPHRLLAPQPAVRYLPDWFKQMPADARGAALQTVKMCAPLVEAMSLGYLLALEHDLELTMSSSRQLSFRSKGKLVDSQYSPRYPGTPLENLIILRIKFPWRLRTPPGHSALILPPLNRFELPLQPFPGLIDSDSDQDELILPMPCLLSPGLQVILPRGSIIAQVIPIERREWSVVCRDADDARFKAAEEAIGANPHIYKDEHWRKKSYA